MFKNISDILDVKMTKKFPFQVIIFINEIPLPWYLQIYFKPFILISKFPSMFLILLLNALFPSILKKILLLLLLCYLQFYLIFILWPCSLQFPISTFITESCYLYFYSIFFPSFFHLPFIFPSSSSLLMFKLRKIAFDSFVLWY